MHNTDRKITRNGLRCLAAVSTVVALASFAEPSAHADQPFPGRAERLLSPGRSAVAEDSAEALVLNPANLGNMPGPELRWTGVRCPDTRRVACGHAFDLATPLLWGLSTGLRVDYIMPPGGPQGAGFPYNGIDYTWLTWGVGYQASPQFSIGASIQGSYSPNPYTSGLFGITAGASYRPNTHFGFAVVAHDFNGPSVQPLPPNGYPVLDRTFVAGMAFRPTGTRASSSTSRRSTSTCSISSARAPSSASTCPGVGRIRGDVEANDLGNDTRRGILATAGAEIYFNAFSAGGGALFGSALGRDTSVGEYATASISGYQSPGVPRSETAVSIRMESTPGTRNHVRLLRRLWKIAEDREIVARHDGHARRARDVATRTPRSSPTRSACSRRTARRSSAASRTPAPRRSTPARARTASSSIPPAASATRASRRRTCTSPGCSERSA